MIRTHSCAAGIGPIAIERAVDETRIAGCSSQPDVKQVEPRKGFSRFRDMKHSVWFVVSGMVFSPDALVGWGNKVRWGQLHMNRIWWGSKEGWPSGSVLLLDDSFVWSKQIREFEGAVDQGGSDPGWFRKGAGSTLRAASSCWCRGLPLRRLRPLVDS